MYTNDLENRRFSAITVKANPSERISNRTIVPLAKIWFNILLPTVSKHVLTHTHFGPRSCLIRITSNDLIYSPLLSYRSRSVHHDRASTEIHSQRAINANLERLFVAPLIARINVPPKNRHSHISGMFLVE